MDISREIIKMYHKSLVLVSLHFLPLLTILDQLLQGQCSSTIIKIAFLNYRFDISSRREIVN